MRYILLISCFLISCHPLEVEINVEGQQPKINVVALFWQSNSVVRCQGAQLDTIPFVYQLSPGGNWVYPIGQDGDIIPALEPLKNPSTGITANSLSWVIEYCKQFGPSPANQFLIVPCARGSSGFHPGNPAIANWSQSGLRYQYLIDRVNKALEIEGAVFHSLVGIGGENDSEGALFNPNFANDLDELITQFRADIKCDEAPVILGTMAESFVKTRGQTAKMIQDVITDTPNRLSNVGIANLKGAKTFDAVHYDVTAVRYIIPQAFAKAYTD